MSEISGTIQALTAQVNKLDEQVGLAGERQTFINQDWAVRCSGICVAAKSLVGSEVILQKIGDCAEDELPTLSAWAPRNPLHTYDPLIHLSFPGSHHEFAYLDYISNMKHVSGQVVGVDPRTISLVLQPTFPKRFLVPICWARIINSSAEPVISITPKQ